MGITQPGRRRAGSLELATGELQVFLVEAPPRAGMSGSLWGVGCCPRAEEASPGSGDVEGWGQSTLRNPSHWPPGALQVEVSLSAVTPTPKLPEPESRAGDCSLPRGGRGESVAPGSYIRCNVRFKCHCCRRLTPVPTQWAARGASAASSSSWQSLTKRREIWFLKKLNSC